MVYIMNKYGEFASFPNLFLALINLIAPEGIQASTAKDYEGAIFARDSIQVALDLLEQMPQLARLKVIPGLPL